MQSIDKDLLFYSSRCQHCDRLLTSISNARMRDDFLFVSVDRKGLKIPSFVDRVPVIFTRDRRVLVDDDIDAFLHRKLAGPLAAVETVKDHDVMPFTMGATLNVDQYVYITDDGNAYNTEDDRKITKDMMHHQNWVSIDDDARIGVDARNDNDEKTSKYVDDKSYEKYMDARKRDEDMIKKTLQQQQTGAAFVR